MPNKLPSSVELTIRETSKVLAVGDMLQERIRQDAKYGGPDHDDEHDAYWWLELIDNELTEGIDATVDCAFDSIEAHAARAILIRIGALAIAAVESIDRCGAR